jgi:hypothetical protein
MGLVIGVLAVAVKLGMTVENVSSNGESVHMVRVDSSFP